jgi:hypothetical protein
MTFSQNTHDTPDYPEVELTKHAAALFKKRLHNTVWFHVPNGELRERITAALLKQMGVRSGVADFILLCRGQGIAVEIKTRNGRQSENQKGFEEAWKKAGGTYVIVRTPKEIEGLFFHLMLD